MTTEPTPTVLNPPAPPSLSDGWLLLLPYFPEAAVFIRHGKPIAVHFPAEDALRRMPEFRCAVQEVTGWRCAFKWLWQHGEIGPFGYVIARGRTYRDIAYHDVGHDRHIRIDCESAFRDRARERDWQFEEVTELRGHSLDGRLLEAWSCHSRGSVAIWESSVNLLAIVEEVAGSDGVGLISDLLVDLVAGNQWGQPPVGSEP